jgi:hypothetical protein
MVDTRVLSISYTGSTWVPLVDARIIMGTLDDARIHMGIPLTLHDVCKH